MKRHCYLALAGLLIACVLGEGKAQDAKSEAKSKVETISYEDFGKLIRAEKGKVVCVYIWANY